MNTIEKVITRFAVKGIPKNLMQISNKKTNIAENGKIVAALIDDHEATLKRMRKKGPSIALESANPAYETKIYNNERVKIQGVLASLYRKF